MQLDLWSKGLPALSVDCVVAGVFDEYELASETRALDAAAAGRIKAIVARGDFAGRMGETLLLTEVPGVKAGRILLTGLGPARSFTRKAWRRAYAAAIAALARTRIKSAAIAIERPAARELDDYYFGRAIAEIAGSTLYRINDLKTGKSPPLPVLERLVAGPVRSSAAATARRGFAHGNAVAAAMTAQRDLANLPGNVCTPIYLADRARAMAKKYGALRVKVLDEAGIRREKMGCFLAVTQGSAQPPRFIVLDYRGAKQRSGAPVVLVGKGITFDTGGISLKDPAAHGRDEVRHEWRGCCPRRDHLRGRSDLAAARRRSRRQPARTCRAAAPSSPATSSRAPPDRRWRFSTPTPRAG